VRLKCPKGAGNCETQKPTVRSLSKGGDGCDDTLMWWVTDYLNPPKTPPKKPKGPPKKTAKTYTMSDLPRECRAVLSAR
jgi:penicillin-insensitive murein endopeptidase